MKSLRMNFCRDYHKAKRFLKGLEDTESFSSEDVEDCRRAIEGMACNTSEYGFIFKRVNYDVVPTNLWGELSMKGLSKKIVNIYNELNSNLIK